MKKLLITSVVALTFALVLSCVGCAQTPEPETQASSMSARELKAAYPLSNRMHSGHDLQCTFCHDDLDSLEDVAPVPNEKCLSCHVSYEEVAKKTSDLDAEQVNPHNNFHYDMQLDCVTCHKGHEESTNFCSNCHDADLWMNETP